MPRLRLLHRTQGTWQKGLFRPWGVQSTEPVAVFAKLWDLLVYTPATQGLASVGLFGPDAPKRDIHEVITTRKGVKPEEIDQVIYRSASPLPPF